MPLKKLLMILFKRKEKIETRLAEKSIIGKKKAKEGFECPIVRFPLEFKDYRKRS